MIYDKIENAGIYKGISDRLDKALDLIMNLDVNLEAGNYAVDEKKLHYIVQEYETQKEADCKYETHKNYIDIQLLVKGTEFFRCIPKGDQEVTFPYNPEKDVEFYKMSEGYDFRLVPGTFALVFPDEVHAPKLMAEKQEPVKKVVVKVLA